MGESHSQFDGAVADLKKYLSLLSDLGEPILQDSPLPVMTPSVKATDLAKPGQSPMLQRLPLEQLKAKIREGHREGKAICAPYLSTIPAGPLNPDPLESVQFDKLPVLDET